MNAAPVVVPGLANGQLDVFAQGSFNQLLHATYTQNINTGGSWSSWDLLGGIFSGAPAVVAGGMHAIDIFVLGMDAQYWQASWSGGSWGSLSWSRVPGNGLFNGPPAAAVVGSNNLVLFGRGIDGHYYVNQWTGAWSGWSDAGFGQDVYISDPVAVTHGSEVDVFGQGTDWGYWHRALVNGSWSNIEKVGSTATYSGPPAATGSSVSPDPTMSLLFGVGIDETSYYWSANPSGIGSWSELAQYANASGFGAAALTITPGPNGHVGQAFAFVHGGDHNLWFNSETAGLTNGWGGWSPLSGVSLQ